MNTKIQQKFIKNLEEDLANDPDIGIEGFNLNRLLENEKEMIMNDCCLLEDEADRIIDDFVFNY